MATLSEVARLAGVSIGSASRVFNRHPTVTPETANAVHKAAEELSYLHPSLRRAPSGIEVRRIALITLGMDRSLSNLPVIATLLQGVHTRASSFGLDITVCDVPDLNAVPRVLHEKGVDAVVLKAALQGDAKSWQSPAVTAATNLPHVWLLGRPSGCSGDTCNTDDQAVGRIAAEYLSAKGHKHVAFLNPKPDHESFLQREAAFCWHAGQAGLRVARLLSKPAKSVLPIKPVGDISEVEVLLEKCLKMHDRPTAVFVPADSIAVLLYRAMAQRGLQPGKDLGIISCNNETALCAALFPTLTTIDIRAEQIGSYGVDHVVWRAAHPADFGEISTTLAPTLVEGGSVQQIK